tara:strand:- start:458 stop:577 length:120 start_codon:yes stop_codon:yes gene_type:complete
MMTQVETQLFRGDLICGIKRQLIFVRMLGSQKQYPIDQG